MNLKATASTEHLHVADNDDDDDALACTVTVETYFLTRISDHYYLECV